MEEQLQTSASTPEQESTPQPSHIVGVGASAGGLEALQEFFHEITPDCGAAFVVVQHLSPDFVSLMDEILARHTTLTIEQAQDGLLVAPDTIYLLPPRKNIVIRDGCLHLTEQQTRHGLNLPIDFFFQSLAEDVAERAIAVVLSGTGSDGSRGIRAIKEAGGTVMVQDEVTAKFDGMPRAAIATGLADFVQSPAELAEQLRRLVSAPGFRENKPSQQLLKETTKLDEVVRILQNTHGADFSLYKPGTLSRRIERRMGINHISDLDKYLLLLRESTSESAALTKDLLIGVTRFFRDGDVWEMVRTNLLPKLLAETPRNETLRFWVPACSTGEEAYTLAMMIEESLSELGTERPVKVFATDVDQQAIDKASEGRYADIIAADVGPRRLSRFFIRRGSGYEIVRSLREMVVFARHDLLRDPPFTKLDLITCRNFLIYVRTSAQQHVLSMLHFALRPTGFLALGESETPGDLQFAFKPVSEKLRIYQRDPAQTVPVVRSQTHMDIATRLRAPLSQPDLGLWTPQKTPSRRAFDYIAQHYCPPAVVVSASFEVMHTFGDVSDYLRTPPGAFTADVSKTATDEVKIALVTALHRASKSNEPVLYRDVRVKVGQEVRIINLRAEPLPGAQNEPSLLLIVFEERRRTPIHDGIEFDESEQKDSRISDLEFDLQQTKESLQATIEELETSNEELQSTNEELLASNEELQSTNEELHSVNEELYTVNAEYQSKIKELTRLTDDFDNLLRSTQLGTVFVDRTLRIRRFTPAVCDVIHLMDHDLGRPVQQFSSSLREVQLGECVRRVIDREELLEEEVQTESGTWYLLRVLPFMSERQEVDGAVMTLIPIDRIKASEAARRESEEFLQASLDSLSAEIAILDADGVIVYVNQAWREFAMHNDGTMETCGPGQNYLAVCEHAMAGDGGSDEIAALVAGIRGVLAGSREEFVADYPCHSRTEQRWFTLRVRPFAGAGPWRVCISHQNITVQKRTEAALRRETEDRKKSEGASRRAATQLASIVDSALDGIITIDHQGIVQTVNASVQRMFGYAPDELVGNSVSLLMPSPHRDQHGQYLERYYETGEPRIIGTGRELMGQRKDGSQFPLHLSVSEFWIDGERMFTGILRDITNQRTQVAAIRRTADLLEATNRDLEQFATIAAHDLHEPLRTIKGYCQLLRDRLSEKLEDTETLQFERIEAAVGHLQGQIDALRQYSQIGPHNVDRRAANINQVIDNAIASLDSTLRQAGADVRRDDMPQAEVNPELLERVFQNLIDNAVKYRGRRKPKIVIKSAEKDAEWVFGVQDNGIGVRPEHHDRVFQMFKRLNPGAKSAGMGAGLAIAKRIVDKHGGRIWVESTPGQGSTFYFSIPREPSVDGKYERGASNLAD